MLVEEYLDIPLGIHWLDPIFFLESFFSSIFRPIRPPWNIRTSQNTFCTDLKIICQPIRSSSTIHWSPNHSPLQCTDALMMHIAHDIKHTRCECHSYPTSLSWCFTDKWKYTSNIWLFQQRKKLTHNLGHFRLTSAIFWLWGLKWARIRRLLLAMYHTFQKPY